MIANRMRIAAVTLGILLAPLPGQAGGEVLVKGCGYLTDDGGCLHLVVPGVGSYQLWDTSYSAGDTVFVWGYTNGSYEPTCVEADAYLDAYFGPCGIIDYGCGVLVDCGEDPGQCDCLQTEDRGLVMLLDYDGFSLGDTVHVTGNPFCCWITWCVYDEMTSVEQIVGCDSPPATSELSWGRLRSLFRPRR